MTEIPFIVSLFLSISSRQVTVTNHYGSIQPLAGKESILESYDTFMTFMAVNIHCLPCGSIFN